MIILTILGILLIAVLVVVFAVAGTILIPVLDVLVAIFVIGLIIKGFKFIFGRKKEK